MESTSPSEASPLKKVIIGMLIIGIVGVFGGALFLLKLSNDLPEIFSIGDYRPWGVTQVYAVKGKEQKLIAEFFKERRYLAGTQEIPEILINAFISAEDAHFFEHQGVSPTSILRAFIANFKAGHVVQGGSTITQQVAKSLFLSPEKKYIRKMKEAILAYRLESHLTKEQILYLYLNQIYLGSGAYGVKAAAYVYFQKTLAELTLPEAALIAGLPQAPSKYDPHRHPEKAKARQRYVLRRMFDNGFINQEQLLVALGAPIKIFKIIDINSRTSPYFVEHIRRDLVEKFGEKGLYEEGLTVRVPADESLLTQAETALKNGLRRVDHFMGYRGVLYHHEDPEEIEAFLASQQLSLREKKIRYRTLMPDGALSDEEALTELGFTKEEDYLDEGELYEGIVSEVNDQKKWAKVRIGRTEAVLPLAEMAWAHSPEVNAYVRHNKKIERVSKVLKKGDRILTKLLKKDKQLGVIVALEQKPEVQGALFSIEALTGKVLALVGGYDFKESEFNRAIQAERPMGSVFKPFIYALGIEKGYTATSNIVDAPIIYKDEEFGKWKPDNFGKKFYGDTPYRQALIKSRNIPTIKLVREMEVPNVIQFARRLGFTGTFNEDLSISLGSSSSTLEELTKIYALFPRQGKKINPIYIQSVTDRTGKTLFESEVKKISLRQEDPRVLDGTKVLPPVTLEEPLELSNFPTEEDPDRLMDSRVSFVMTHLLKGVVEAGTGRGAKAIGRIAAGKTGTTSDYRDAWFLGFTPHVVTGVWVGFDDQRGLGSKGTGGGAALPIWVEFMREAVKNYPEEDFIRPPGLVSVNVNALTGKPTRQPAESSPEIIEEMFIRGTEPSIPIRPQAESFDSQGEFLKEDFQ